MDQRVLDLAARIKAAQDPEIATMTGWLEDWGQPTSTSESDDTGGMDHGGMDDMDTSMLESASGTEFDRTFLQMMIEHHTGAVHMANTEIAPGENPDAVALARQIVESQSAEVQDMQTLLGELVEDDDKDHDDRSAWTALGELPAVVGWGRSRVTATTDQHDGRRALLRPCAAVVVTAGVLTLTACARTPAAEPPPPDVGVEHVHGLGVDPADGVLYAATHFGLFRLPEDGEVERVADRYQDTMGFTVAGPGTFLGSGHPDFQMDPQLPTQLGLIRSEDAGRSWEIVSLGGEADLHVLRLAHGSVYGWDAGTGRLLVSADDGASWEVRSTLDLRDLVVNPADPAYLLAATEQGLLRSGDGGRTWAPDPGAPAMAVLAWPTGTSLYGITADGTVHESADGGTTWTGRGTVDGEPEALAVDIRDGAERLYVAVSPATILESADGGVSFTVRYAD